MTAAAGGLAVKPSAAGLRPRGGTRECSVKWPQAVFSGMDFDPTKEKAIAAAKAMAEE